MRAIKVTTDKPALRDHQGRFLDGNKEGCMFKKGFAGRQRGTRNRKTLLAKEFAEDVLYLNHETGKEMTYHDLCMYIKQKADTSPRILNLLLDHVLGKPEETIQETVTFIVSSMPQEVKPIELQGANIQVKDRFQLPAPQVSSEQEEGQEPF